MTQKRSRPLRARVDREELMEKILGLPSIHQTLGTQVVPVHDLLTLIMEEETP